MTKLQHDTSNGVNAKVAKAEKICHIAYGQILSAVIIENQQLSPKGKVQRPSPKGE